MRGASGLLARQRALRGGSWNNDAENLRSETRNWNRARNRNDNVGFRVLLSPANTLTSFTLASHRAGGVLAPLVLRADGAERAWPARSRRPRPSVRAGHPCLPGRLLTEASWAWPRAGSWVS